MTDINNNINELNNKGVTIIKNLFSEEYTELLNKVAKNTIKHTKENILKTIKPKQYDYIRHFDKEYINKTYNYETSDLDIIEITNGRSDISFKTHFDTVNPIIEKIIKNFIKSNKKTTEGLLTSSEKSDDGPWHRDVVNIDKMLIKMDFTMI